jgi:hypothetical protein
MVDDIDITCLFTNSFVSPFCRHNIIRSIDVKPVFCYSYFKFCIIIYTRMTVLFHYLRLKRTQISDVFYYKLFDPKQQNDF